MTTFDTANGSSEGFTRSHSSISDGLTKGRATRERTSAGQPVLPVSEDADDGVVVVADDAGLKMPHPR